jgi:mannitol-1-/sugar-/sorbitol-6-phosphatase
MIMRLLTQLQGPEQRKESPQSLLKNADCRDQSLLETQIKINLSELVAGALDVVGIFDDGIDQILFGGKRPEDGAFGDACRLGNLPRTHLAAEPFQQWLGRRNERGSALIDRQRCCPSHQSSLVSERSLSKRGIIRRCYAVSHIVLIEKEARGRATRDLGRLADEVFEAVIFDLDGTLIDSTPAVIRAWNTWAEEYGLALTEVPRHHGVPSASVVRAALPEDLYEAAVQRITDLELSDLHDIVVLPGATDALASLAGAKNAIATSCTVALANARIRAAQLEPPTVMVTADDVVNGKPHPEPFLQAARLLAVDPRRCLVVEDAPKGLEAAQAAGCFTLAVVTTTPRNALDADAIVTDLSEVRFHVNDKGIRLSLVDQPAGAFDKLRAHNSTQGT